MALILRHLNKHDDNLQTRYQLVSTCVLTSSFVLSGTEVTINVIY